MSHKEAKRQRKEQHKARTRLIAALVWDAYPHDENGEFSQEQALAQALELNTLTDKQLLDVATHIEMSRTSLIRTIPRPKNALSYPLKARPVLEVL